MFEKNGRKIKGHFCLFSFEAFIRDRIKESAGVERPQGFLLYGVML